MSEREVATAADYADAMLTARRAKHALVLLLLLLVLGQVALFFVVRYTQIVPLPEVAVTQPDRPDLSSALNYASSGCLFLGVIMSILLSLVLLLIVNIMVVARAIGVGRVTSAFTWSLVLALLLFPWQAFLNNVNLTPDRASFKLPGVLYTWNELNHPTEGARFTPEVTQRSGLKWSRFVGFPLVAVVMLLVIQVKSNRGMRQALGEDDGALSVDATNA